MTSEPCRSSSKTTTSHPSLNADASNEKLTWVSPDSPSAVNSVLAMTGWPSTRNSSAQALPSASSAFFIRTPVMV